MSNYNSRDVWLGMAIPALIFALAFSSAPAMADFQIDQANDDIHAPFDANNTDNELYLTAPVVPNFQYGGTQTAEANQRMKFSLENLPEFLQPFVDLNRGECIRVGTASEATEECAFYQVNAGEVCTLTDPNGDARAANRFASTFTRVIDFSDRDYHKYLYLDVRVYCSDY